MPKKTLSVPVTAPVSTSHKRSFSTGQKPTRRKAQRKISPKSHHSVSSPTTPQTSNTSAGSAGTNRDAWKKKRKKKWHDAPVEVVQAAEVVAAEHRLTWFKLDVRGYPISEHDKLVNTIRTAFKRAYPGKPFYAEWTSVPASARTSVREHAHISVALPDRGIMDATRARLNKRGYVTDLGDHNGSPGGIKGQFGYHVRNQVEDGGTTHRSQDFRRLIRNGTVDITPPVDPGSRIIATGPYAGMTEAELRKQFMVEIDRQMTEYQAARQDSQERTQDIQAPSPTPEAQTESTAPEIAARAPTSPVPSPEDDLRRRLMAMLDLAPDQEPQGAPEDDHPHCDGHSSPC
ncbi:hypothetical protein FBY14_110157 [Azospirillum brasilense]|nr:hypothetical protein FBY14_110157 [Azospirillum brasilense]